MALLKFQSIEYLNSLKMFFSIFLFATFAIRSDITIAQTPKELSSLNDLKSLTIEELMNIEVTSVSKTSEKLTEVASAIQVITQQDIRRSAATSVAEALRLSPNLQVTQLNAKHWIISSRGFNSAFANKLLVMIDGRTVYSPLFAGVYWDAQSVMLEDVDRIEVISGPGGALWGANAVNGVINIITKSAKDTQGLFVSESVGSALEGSLEARYGGNIGSKISYRVYAQHNDRNHTFLDGGGDNTDRWRLSQGGFLMDYNPSDANALTFQGNFYKGNDRIKQNPSSIDGQNVMGKWTHTISDKSDLVVQAYVDRTWRIDIPSTFTDELLTYDIDFQHRFPLGERHHILWGTGYRLMNDKTQHSTDMIAFLPENRNMRLFSSFVQDEIIIYPDRFKLTIGTKLEHNSFSGFELQPSARLTLTPFKQNVLWAAVSRAVRAPSRIDVDYNLPAYPVPPSSPSVAGGPNFTSEKVIAYELGYRVQPFPALSLSLATFYNQYDDLYSVEALPGTLTYQIQNGAKGYSAGTELSGNYLMATNWRLRGGYTLFYKKLRNKPSNMNDPFTLESLGSDAKNQFLLQSILDLPGSFQLDMVTRYISSLPATQFSSNVSSYFTLDTRIAWQFQKKLELSLVGQNLLEKRHIEVGSVQIPRSIYGKITLRY